MKIKISLIIISIVVLTHCTQKEQLEKPPLAKVEVVEDVYFGKTILDPYRYMENLQDPEVTNWIKSQAEYSRSVLNSISGRQSLIEKMREYDQRRSSRITNLSITDNNRYFYLKTTPEDETGKLFYRDGYEGEESFLFDPQEFDQDTTQKYVISALSPSDDGLKVAFEIAPDGSESSVLVTMDVDNKKLFPEQIDRCWYASPSWLPDGSAFLYNRLNSSDVHDKDREKNSKSYLHIVGNDPATDKEIFSRKKNPELDISPEDFPIVIYDKDSRYLYGFVYTVDNRLTVFFAPTNEIDKEKINWKQLFNAEDEVYNFSTTEDELYVYTPKDAPNFKILKTSLRNPDLKNAEIVIPENSEATLTSFGLTNEGLYYTLSKNGVEEKLYRLPFGRENAVELNLPFTAGSISLTTRGYKFSDIWAGLSGWTSEYQRYRFLAGSNEFRLENLSATAEYPEYDDLVAEELMINSHDGVKVPLSLVYKKGIKKNGDNPVLFYGYGSYGASMNPFFSPGLLLWTFEGGILAIAHVRGGGELGDEWHKGGYKTTKPNTWKDLISCAEDLIEEGYTTPKKIAIYSGSAGGILVGRAMTERPELFAAVVPQVGSLNPLRAEESPNGPVNVPEFGTVKDSVECMALIEMDSFHHLKEGAQYPATLITAGMNDPRVIAWEPAKFAARLQAVNSSDNPILFWADYEAGHGIGNTKTKQFESLADVLSFALWQTGHLDFRIN